MKRVTAGFLPLLDAAILIAAREQGFAEEQGIELHLVRETSWANIRDRVSVGQFDVAHMLAPLPIAQNLGLSPLAVEMIAPFALGLGGNAITVSNEIWRALSDGEILTGQALQAGQRLKQLIENRKANGLPHLTFAVVHDFSSHAYELKYWLSASGINPSIDFNLTIVPPGLMADALAAGAIDGFCVGEPWNSVAVAAGAGHLLTTKSSIWQSSPEKVLGMTLRWAEQHQETLEKVLLASHYSAKWCAKPEHAETLAQMLHRTEYLDLPSAHFERGLKANSGFLQFYDYAANFPRQSHALWFYSQMVRWQQVSLSDEMTARVKATYRPDIYRRALQSASVDVPTHDLLVIGPDGFFDGVAFDPDRLENYINASPFYGALHKN